MYMSLLAPSIYFQLMHRFQVLDPSRYSIPLYLNPDDPFCSPILSHNAPSHNVVLKVTIPKRTGRRRKRGSTGPWQTYTSNMPESDSSSKVCSIARLDSPALLKEKLGDAIGKHTVEAVGTIDNTHRFRGLADFIWNMSDSQFAQDFKNKALSGDGTLLMVLINLLLLILPKLPNFETSTSNQGLIMGPTPISSHLRYSHI